MSQIQGFSAATGPAGPILTLTGDVGGAVSPTGGNINILGKDTLPAYAYAEIDGDPGTSTLSVKPLLDELTTVDNAPEVFPNAVFALDPDTAIVFSANVIGNRDDYSAACGGYVTCVARRDAVNPTVIVGQTPLLSRDSMTGLPIFGIFSDGDIIKVGVQGVAGETWNWTCSYQWVVRI